jgi:hypothetical protein
MPKSSQPFLVLHQDQNGVIKPHWCFILFNEGIRSIKIGLADDKKPIPDVSQMVELVPVPNKLQIIFDPNLSTLPNIRSGFKTNNCEVDITYAYSLDRSKIGQWMNFDEEDLNKKGFYFEFPLPNEVHQYAHDGKKNKWFLINSYSESGYPSNLGALIEFMHPKWVTNDDVFQPEVSNDLKDKHGDWILAQFVDIESGIYKKYQALILIAHFWLGRDVENLGAYSLDDLVQALSLSETEACGIITTPSCSFWPTVKQEQEKQWNQRVYLPLERVFRVKWVQTILMNGSVDVKDQAILLLKHVHTIDQLIEVLKELNDFLEDKKALLSSLTKDKLVLLLMNTLRAPYDRTTLSSQYKKLYDGLSEIDRADTIQLFDTLSVEVLDNFIYDQKSFCLLSHEKKEQYRTYMSHLNRLWRCADIFTEDELISLLNQEKLYEVNYYKQRTRVKLDLVQVLRIRVGELTWNKILEIVPFKNALIKYITSEECRHIFTILAREIPVEDSKARQEHFINAFSPDERLQLMATCIEPFKTLMKLFTKEDISTLFFQDQSVESLAMRINKSNRKELLLSCLVVLISIEEWDKVHSLIARTDELLLKPISPSMMKQDDIIQAVNRLSYEVEKERENSISLNTFSSRDVKSRPSTFEPNASFISPGSVRLLLAGLSAALVGGLLLSVVFVAPHFGLVISAAVARLLSQIAGMAIGGAIGFAICALAKPSVHCASRFFHSITPHESGASNESTPALVSL